MLALDFQQHATWVLDAFLDSLQERDSFTAIDDAVVVGQRDVHHRGNDDLTVFGDGLQTRSFCFVDDQVEGIFRLLHSDYIYPVNIGNPDEITIKDFAEEIIKLTGTDQKIVYHPLPVNDPLQRQPDISLAKKLFGWEPHMGRAEGMQITYDYFKSLSTEELLKEEHKDFSGYIH